MQEVLTAVGIESIVQVFSGGLVARASWTARWMTDSRSSAKCWTEIKPMWRRTRAAVRL
jgi:hypothetical protein